VQARVELHIVGYGDELGKPKPSPMGIVVVHGPHLPEVVTPSQSPISS
jgi:hypothetical protein